MIPLRGMTWDHPRGYRPLRAFETSGLSPERVDWDVQSLADFEAHPLDELARTYDLLVVDHPGLGAGIVRGAILALDEVFSTEELAAWQGQSVPPTWQGYRLGGRQWAIPIDAATQVSMFRADRLADPPARWDGIAAVSRYAATALCLGGPHALLTLLACCADSAEPRPSLLPVVRAEAALELLQSLWPMVDRSVSLGDPIGVHEAIAAGVLDYCPLAYGYAAYARPEPGRAELAFADAPSWLGSRPGSVLGGTGLAVAARPADGDDDGDRGNRGNRGGDGNCGGGGERRERIRRWIRAFLAEDVQTGLVPAHGGQPASAAVWNSPGVGGASGGYYSHTLRSLTSAWIRPRYDGWIDVQDEGSAIVRDCIVGARDPRAAVAQINRLHDRRRGSDTRITESRSA
ncbi:hypothetical protein M6D93_07045 [Jatrophihabitans telluris]|uniref:Carbohydrate ABC transporter substrate-binding protein n=1 Tax=Jatrophihabitans telluris TaxID=2038343 RepID=A0ABY4R1M3_9ACTN|nr:hypothetical protein [Jatrophihabitans telluris]UQX89749.1 hypothetical protein M6D93_07045 [Jatrophihabitans telluris]